MTIQYAPKLDTAHRLLRDQVARVLGLALDSFSDSTHRPWSSVRFSGTRHQFRFGSDAPLDARARAALASHEFALDGEIVADVTIATTVEGYRVEALTVEGL